MSERGGKKKTDRKERAERTKDVEEQRREEAAGCSLTAGRQPPLKHGLEVAVCSWSMVNIS